MPPKKRELEEAGGGAGGGRPGGAADGSSAGTPPVLKKRCRSFDLWVAPPTLDRSLWLLLFLCFYCYHISSHIWKDDEKIHRSSLPAGRQALMMNCYIIQYTWCREIRGCRHLQEVAAAVKISLEAALESAVARVRDHHRIHHPHPWPRTLPPIPPDYLPPAVPVIS